MSVTRIFAGFAATNPPPLSESYRWPLYAHKIPLFILLSPVQKKRGDQSSFKQRSYEATADLVLRFTMKFFALLRRFGVDAIDVVRSSGLVFVLPYPLNAEDHILLLFRKVARL